MFDSMIPLTQERTMEQVVSESVARQHFNMVLLSVFAGVALLLAAIGIYFAHGLHGATAHPGDRDSYRPRAVLSAWCWRRA